jgi:16S rRNA (cytosine967-C5)-methyltransferase
VISHLQQPDVFVRMRPDKKLQVEQQLKAKNIDFVTEGNAVRFAPNTKVEQVLAVNKDVIVQDISSQRIGELIEKIEIKHSPFKVWDCCAASGGKSILAIDQFKIQYPKSKIELTVTDVRSTILHNLQKRFSEAGITHFRSFVADLTKPINNSSELFDLIICDAPCSGSGTWGRTPEQLVFFTEDKIEYYSNLQQSIVSNASKQLKENGYFLYITCSVFAEENEKIVSFISEDLKLKLVEMKYFKGYNEKADTLFAALFTV